MSHKALISIYPHTIPSLQSLILLTVIFTVDAKYLIYPRLIFLKRHEQGHITMKNHVMVESLGLLYERRTWVRTLILLSSLWSGASHLASLSISKEKNIAHLIRLVREINRCSLKSTQGLPRWSSGWEPACHSRGHGFDPWSGKIPHAIGRHRQRRTASEPVLGSLGATQSEPAGPTYGSPACPRACAPEQRRHPKEKGSPRSPQLENALAATRTQRSRK